MYRNSSNKDTNYLINQIIKFTIKRMKEMNKWAQSIEEARAHHLFESW